VPQAARPPALVLQVLRTVGFEVGDYHHPDGWWVVYRNKVWQVQLEGWGAECVPEGTIEAADRAAGQLAQTWLQQGLTKADWLPVQDNPEVWAITYGIAGPYGLDQLQRVDPDTVIDFRES